ncbi:PREDICTED: uncharacterized protein LOC109593359, partial [Amphimedon queenslandica]|uniref:Uncharacterized protein n=2 Tax=Amphimedon queenslandica TaxID=400682 RepID=A0AAN0K4D8_AMPQE
MQVFIFCLVALALLVHVSDYWSGMAFIRLVNTSVLSDSKILLPWSIIRLNDEAITIEEFYRDCVEPRLEGNHFQVSSAYVGQDRNSLDLVDELSLPVLSVVSLFGPFLRYLVVSTSPSPVHNDVSTHNSTLLTVQAYSVNERTRKDKIFNDIVSFLASSSVSFEESEFDDGKQLL